MNIVTRCLHANKQDRPLSALSTVTFFNPLFGRISSQMEGGQGAAHSILQRKKLRLSHGEYLSGNQGGDPNSEEVPSPIP